MRASTVFFAIAASIISGASAQVAIADASAEAISNGGGTAIADANAVAIANGAGSASAQASALAIANAPVYALSNATVVGSLTCTPTAPITRTITALTVSTYCPVCDAAKATGGVYTTTYATVLVAVCPTGLVSSTYTVTATATGTTPVTLAGFTTTATVCTACAGSPTITVTIPISTSAAATTTTVRTSGASAVSTVSFMAAGIASVFAAMLLL